MPINAGYEYGEAQKKVIEAKTTEEKIRALENLLSVSPNHKGAERLRQELKSKISSLRLKVEKEKARKKGGFSIAIKKEGAAQVILVGLANSGKSSLLNALTNVNTEVASYEFTTKAPVIGIMDYEGVQIQLIELPAMFPGYSASEKGPSYMSILRSADLIVIVVDGTHDCLAQLRTIEHEFHTNNISLSTLRNPKPNALPCLVVVNKTMHQFQSPYSVCWHEDLRHSIWTKLGLIWVRTKMPSKKADWPPVALPKGATVRDLAGKVHKDFVKNFEYARIWGKSVKHEGLTVGLDHMLAEGDIVEVHTK